jgi:cytochrome b6-f complex iron-sulfur subunit
MSDDPKMPPGDASQVPTVPAPPEGTSDRVPEQAGAKTGAPARVATPPPVAPRAGGNAPPPVPPRAAGTPPSPPPRAAGTPPPPPPRAAGAPPPPPRPAGAAAAAAKPAAPAPDLAGKTTSVAAASAAPAAAKPGREADDTSPLLSRRAWIGLSWGAFTAASAAALAATGRFMFPNVLNEPPQQFKAGFPADYGPGVDERWKEKFGVWIVRTPDDIVQHASGFFALLTTCTHLGCTPNYLSAEGKFKCPCHGSGFRLTGINFEGPAPRPLERARIVLAEDGQILVDKSRKFQFELGQWIDPEAFLKA